MKDTRAGEISQFWTSLGYTASGADLRLRHFMAQPRTLLVDLRKDPCSKYRQWDAHALLQDWGSRYRRAGEYLGNSNYGTGKEIAIPRLEEGVDVLAQYLAKRYSLVLLCGCLNFDRCHRAIVVQALRHLLKQRNSPTHAAYIIEDTPFPGQMNCLSIKQPYAEIICRAPLFRALGVAPKDIENRSWTTPWRGKIAIHASTTFETGLFKKKIIDPLYWQDRFGTLAASLVPVHKDQYHLGEIIGVAELCDIVTASESPWYVPGQYGFVLKDILPIDPTIPMRGGPRLFQIPETVLLSESSHHG